MKRALSLIVPLLVFIVPAYSAEVATFTLNNGSVREAIFVIMKENYIFVQIPKPGGEYEKICFYKILVRNVAFRNGRKLDLSKSNSPVDLNDANRMNPNKMRFQYKTISKPADFQTYQVEIAVRTLAATGIPESEASTVSDVLRAELTKTGKYQVFEREQMQEVLKEQGFQQSGACNEACVVEMGQLLGVKFIVIGSITRMGQSYSVSARMVDVTTGKIVSDINEFIKGTREMILIQSMPRLAQRIAGTYKPAYLSKRVWIPAACVAGATAIIVPVMVMRKGGEPEQEQATGGVGILW